MSGRNALAAAGRFWLAWADEALIVCGTACMAYGLWQAWRPGAWIVAGGVVLWLVLPSRAPFVLRPSEKARQRREVR